MFTAHNIILPDLKSGSRSRISTFLGNLVSVWKAKLVKVKKQNTKINPLQYLEICQSIFY